MVINNLQISNRDFDYPTKSVNQINEIFHFNFTSESENKVKKPNIRAKSEPRQFRVTRIPIRNQGK